MDNDAVKAEDLETSHISIGVKQEIEESIEHASVYEETCCIKTEIDIDETQYNKSVTHKLSPLSGIMENDTLMAELDIETSDIPVEVKQQTEDEFEQASADEDTCFIKTEIDIGETQYKDAVFGCPQCEYTTSSHVSLQHHIEAGHASTSGSVEKRDESVDNIKRHKCDTCQKTFLYESNLKVHVKIHTGDKPYVCVVCDKSFTQMHHLKIHMRRHSGEKPYECNVCHKTFSTISNLKRHTMTHAGERPYKCDVCGKTYLTSSHLTNHKRKHTGEKPYQCTVCHRTFSRTCNLKNHIALRHTEERPFRCELCDKSYKLPTILKRHMKYVHIEKKTTK